jgi:hypothetical protein
MEERRQEIRRILEAVPDSIKDVIIKYQGCKPLSAVTVDVNSMGMAFISKDKSGLNIDIGAKAHIRFDMLNLDLNGDTVYSYPLPDERLRIGVLFKSEKSIKQYYKILDEAAQA